MSPLLVILVVFILLFGFGGNFYNGGAYRGYGWGGGGLLLLILVLLLLHVI